MEKDNFYGEILLDCDPNEGTDFVEDESAFCGGASDDLRELDWTVVNGTDNFRSETEEKEIRHWDFFGNSLWPFFTAGAGMDTFGFVLFSTGLIFNLWIDVVELAKDLFEYESGREFNKLFFVICTFSRAVIVKSVWIDFVASLAGVTCSLCIDSAILSLSISSISSSSSISSMVPSSLIVMEWQRRRGKSFCSCWSWCRINETLSVKSASMISGAKK